MATERHARTWPGMMAPGKLFLAGEYGVLVGARALVAAIDRHVVMLPEHAGVTLRSTEDPLIQSLLDEARRHTELPLEDPVFDDSRLRSDEGTKLGLGSSAAKAAALMAGAFELSNESSRDAHVRERILAAAWRAHRRAGGGSGADVAAAVMGGAVRFALVRQQIGRTFLPTPAEDLEYSVESTPLPEAHFPIVLHGGSPVSTRDALLRLDAALEAGSTSHEAHLLGAARAGERLSYLLSDHRSSRGEVTRAVREASEALLSLVRELGLEARAGLETLAAADALARRHGGAAKPSGAAGGDIVLVFVPDLSIEERTSLAGTLDRAGLHVLHLGLDEGGVRSTTAPEQFD